MYYVHNKHDGAFINGGGIVFAYDVLLIRN